MMITRYLVVEPQQTHRHKSILMPDDDVLSITELQTTVVATLDDGRKIVHALLDKNTIQSMRDATGLDDPLTIEGVGEIKITTRYAGETMEDVLVNFPKLAIQNINIDENGNKVLSDKFIRNTFLGQIHK